MKQPQSFMIITMIMETGKQSSKFCNTLDVLNFHSYTQHVNERELQLIFNHIAEKTPSQKE